MAEYIDREALMRRIKEIHCAECDSYNGVRCRACWVDDTLDYIESEPAADVEPVVRCRECVHWKPTESKAGNSFSDMKYIGGCEFTNYCRSESDFCSYGERKEGDGNG